MVRVDLRKKQFKGRKILYGEIINKGFFPSTELIVHARIPDNPQGRVVRIHRDTIQYLRRADPWKRGWILMGLYQDRPEVLK